MTEETLAAALSYVRRGWSALPEHTIGPDGICTCNRPSCDKPGKHPRGDTWGQFQAKIAAETEVRLWFKRWPAAGVGIATGAVSGLVVLDVDPRHGGDESLKDLGPLPDTVTAITGGGGQHLYFAHPGGMVKNRSGFLPGLDIRGDGGQVVAPPSMHASGRQYEWEPGYAPGEMALAPIPPALLALITETGGAVWGEQPRAARDDLDGYAAGEGEVPEGERNMTMTRLAGRWFGEGDSPDKVLRQLLYVNQMCCRPPLERSEVQIILRSIHQAQQRKEAAIERIVQPIAAADLEVMPNDDRLALARAAFLEGLHVDDVVDFIVITSPEGKQYQVEFPERVVTLGESMLNGQRQIRSALERIALVPAMKQPEWDRWAFKLAQLAREIRTGYARVEEEVHEWMDEYRRDAVDCEQELRADHLRTGPILYEGRLAVRTRRLKMWVESNFALELSSKELGRKLTLAGWKYQNIRAGETTLKVWLSPPLS